MDRLTAAFEKKFPKEKTELLVKAINFAKSVHADQKRESQEPYYIHPEAVALILLDMDMDADTVIAGLLHDTVEDGHDITVEKIAQMFGKDIARMVDGVTKLTNSNLSHMLSKEDRQAENLRKMFLAIANDVRVVVIKLADRLHNMRTLGYCSKEKRVRKARETMDVYAPLADRFGMGAIKVELEDLSFSYLMPEECRRLQSLIEPKQEERMGLLKKAMHTLEIALKDAGIKAEVSGRRKHIYSIYRKLNIKKVGLNEIYDLVALRIIVDTVQDCYGALGIVHSLWRPFPGRFKDYISMPKTNMYRSLHTTLFSDHGMPFEVQIRTWEMHRDAEYGLAAHWKYKSGEQVSEVVDRKLQWIRTLLETEKDGDDLDEFVRPLKIDLFEDETFVFTPKGDVVSLPNGATPIDFAYAIHSAVGNKMVGAKVNGNIVPIDYKLQTGQIVEVLTSAASKGPSRDWLKIVRSGEARNKIRQYFKREMRQENIQVGKTEVDRELRRFGRNYTEAQKEEIVRNVAARLSLEVEDFYNNIGYGGLSVSKLTTKLRDEFTRVVNPSEAAAKQPEKTVRPDRKAEDRSQSVILDGLEGCDVKFAKCCNPLPGDPIIGFITKGFGVSIHKYDCPNAVAGLRKPEDKDRWIVASWAQKPDRQYYGNFEAVLHIYARYSPKIIADVTVCLADLKVALNSVTTRENGDSMLLIVGLKCSSIEHLKNIIGALKKLPDVRDVTRAGR